MDFLFKPIVPEILRSKVSVFVELSRNTALLRRQAEVLGKAEQKFRSLLEAAPDAMIISSEEGGISLVNSQAEIDVRILARGADRTEYPDAGAGLERQTARDLPPSGRFAQGSCGRGARIGIEFPVEISLSPLQTEEGLLVTSAIRDITERKRADERFAS